jgi:hypothetical protein
MRASRKWRRNSGRCKGGWFAALRSCTELKKGVGAGDGLRTRYLNLGKVALYRVSYSRVRIGAHVTQNQAGFPAAAGPRW